MLVTLTVGRDALNTVTACLVLEQRFGAQVFADERPLGWAIIVDLSGQTVAAQIDEISAKESLGELLRVKTSLARNYLDKDSTALKDAPRRLARRRW